MLVVGAGPAGLEAARALGQRGYRVVLAEATRELGGRVSREARLPGLAAWMRVRDWRAASSTGCPNVEVTARARLTADDVLGFGFDARRGRHRLRAGAPTASGAAHAAARRWTPGRRC